MAPKTTKVNQTEIARLNVAEGLKKTQRITTESRELETAIPKETVIQQPMGLRTASPTQEPGELEIQTTLIDDTRLVSSKRERLTLELQLDELLSASVSNEKTKASPQQQRRTLLRFRITEQ